MQIFPRHSLYLSSLITFMLLLRRQSRLICSISKKMGNKTDWVEAQIKGNKVVVFSKTYCPFCDMAKKALAEVGLSDYLLYELDNRDDGEEIMDILKRITGGRTVSFLSF